MFQAGDVIVCGSHGVCRVEKVGPISSAAADRDRIYYTLKPLYERGSVVFTPVDNQKMVIRPVISREEALRLIDGMRDAEGLGIQDEKKREEGYKEALKTCRAEELVRMMKTIYARGRSRAARGKKATDADSRYLKLAEDYLFRELAVSLDLDRDQVKAFIRERIGREED